ncbi:hypothetical protein VCR15J2_390080 [Vibrio coralliirubri]|uniref:hypothetical protein n=1 Tax=Vibrio coralliirubri TaxID=1516159 RepID=UPI000639116E|nr:hypothetical protein [Vibrio coralliirubri]CDT53497.1 hypothetical protein VCR15J2_390080 [Vibrio coralliirubri]
MSNNMMMSVIKQSIEETKNSAFVKEFVELPVDLTSQLIDLDHHRLDKLQELYRRLIKYRYETLEDLAIAVDEIVDRNKDSLPVFIDEDVEWDGYVNSTEEPKKVEIERGTEFHLLEFVRNPKDGLIFQLCLGEGPEGLHFNIPMDQVVSKSESLMTILKQAAGLREADAELEEIAQVGMEDGDSWS